MILNIASSGDNIVSASGLYGGTWNLFANTLRTMGIEVRFVDAGNPENFRKATDARTRAYYAEALPNPMLKVFPIAEVAAISEELGVPLILDNRSEEHTSELQSLMRISYAVFCLKKKNTKPTH